MTELEQHLGEALQAMLDEVEALSARIGSIESSARGATSSRASEPDLSASSEAYFAALEGEARDSYRREHQAWKARGERLRETGQLRNVSDMEPRAPDYSVYRPTCRGCRWAGCLTMDRKPGVYCLQLRVLMRASRGADGEKQSYVYPSQCTMRDPPQPMP